MRLSHTLATLVLVAAVGGLSGCGPYYKITDPTTGETYYTKGVDKRTGGGITFTDESNGQKVTLQTSEREKVRRQEYMAAIHEEHHDEVDDELDDDDHDHDDEEYERVYEYERRND